MLVRPHMRRRIILAAVLIGGCLEAGLNQNQQAPGNGETGVDVGIGDIAIDPGGRYVFYTSGDRLQYADLVTRTHHRVKGLVDAQRFAFGPAGSGVVYAVGRPAAGEDFVLIAYHLGQSRTLWSRPVTIGFAVEGNRFSVLPWVTPTPDGGALVVTHSMRVEVLDAARGTVRHEVALEKNVADVDLVPGQDRVLITEWHRWNGDSPMTRIQSLDLGTGRVIRFEVPNCSSELVLTPDAHHAFLSPSNCRKDPVSLIDLDENLWLRNLPGFGPVAVAPDGMLAVAFLDATAVEPQLFDDPSQIPSIESGRYHLMLIDTATLGFRTVPLGDSLPRYAITPDGHILLVDSPSWVSDGRLRLLDVLAARMVPLTGTEDVRLENYVVTTDATRVFLLYHGLYRVDVGDARLVPVPLAFAPLNLNITPDDRKLLLREDDDTMWIYDIEGGRLDGSIDIGPVAIAPTP